VAVTAVNDVIFGTPFGARGPQTALESEAPTGIEPVDDFLRSLEPKIRLYVEHFRALGDGDEP